MRPEEAHGLRFLGDIEMVCGNYDAARENLDRARTIYRELDMRYWLERIGRMTRTLYLPSFCGVRGEKRHRGIEGYQGGGWHEPGAAKFDGMPRSAISADMADHVLAPEKMPETLLA